MDFNEFLKNNNPELYEKSLELDALYRISKVRRNMEQRKRKEKIEKLKHRFLTTGLLVLTLTIATQSTTNIFASEDFDGIKEVQLTEQEEKILIDEIKQSHSELLFHMSEQARISKMVSTQFSQLVVSRGSKRTVSVPKTAISPASTEDNFTNTNVEYVKANNLNVALSNVTMSVDHQEYLYILCKDKGLDFVKTLAVIKHESGFNPNAQGVNKDDYGNIKSYDQGYMQINSGNRNWLTEATGLPNSPFNPYVNMEWGTYMLRSLYDELSSRGLSGDDLDNAVWSAYNMGLGGYNKYGIRWVYVDKVREAYNSIK